MLEKFNLLSSLPSARAAEAILPLLTAKGMRLERIVSHGQSTPDGLWYDQAEAEWVLLLSGAARLAVEGEPEEQPLAPGDVVFLAPHLRHRVSWTDPDRETVWLVLFVDPELEPVAVTLSDAA
jgi:cupin 2 domain-containing protein